MSKKKNHQKLSEPVKEKIQEIADNSEALPVDLEEVDVDAINDEAEIELADAESEGEEPEVELEVMEEEEKPLRCVGVHPVTLEKVYR